MMTSPFWATRLRVPWGVARERVFRSWVISSVPILKRSMSAFPVTGCLSLSGRQISTIAPCVSPLSLPRSRMRSRSSIATTVPVVSKGTLGGAALAV
jgi:hypothetical protein